MEEDLVTLNDEGLKWTIRRALEFLASRDLPDRVKAILLSPPREQKVNVTTFRFRFESFITDSTTLASFRRSDMGSTRGDKVPTLNRLQYLSKTDTNGLITSLGEELDDSNMTPSDDQDRKTNLLERLEEGTEKIGEMQHFSHPDFASIYQCIYKVIPMTGKRNRWAITVNTGQFLFWLDFDQDCTLIVRDILLGMAEIYYFWNDDSGNRNFSKPFLFLHKVYPVVDLPGESRILVQDKVHGIPFIIVDDIIDESIKTAFDKASSAPDCEEMIAEAKEDCSHARKARWKSLTSLEAITGNMLWTLTRMSANPVAGAPTLQPSTCEFVNPIPFSTDSNAKILAIGGTFRYPRSITIDLGVNPEVLNFSASGISPVQFVVVSALATRDKKTYIVNLGDYDIFIMGKSMSKDPKHFHTLKIIPKAKLTFDITKAENVNGFLRYIAQKDPISKELNFSRKQLFDGIVIKVGGFLFKFSATKLKDESEK